MPPRIQTTDKLTAADGVKALVYGSSGVGKTSLAATAQSPLIFSAEKGLLSLRKFKIPYVDVSGYAELTEAYKWLLGSSEARTIGTLFLDSASEIAEVILAAELKKSPDPRKAYGNMQQSVYEMFRSFRDIKSKHVVLIAKQISIQDGMNTKSIPLMPSEKLQAQVPYFWDLVLHMHIGVNTANGVQYRAFHTQDAPFWSAKDRSGNLDPLELPNINDLFNKALL
jgi:hypothetical protein